MNIGLLGILRHAIPYNYDKEPQHSIGTSKGPYVLSTLLHVCVETSQRPLALHRKTPSSKVHSLIKGVLGLGFRV